MQEAHKAKNDKINGKERGIETETFGSFLLASLAQLSSYRRDASRTVDAFLWPQRDDVLEFFHHAGVGFAASHQTCASLALLVHLRDPLLTSQRRSLLRHRDGLEDSFAFL